MNVVIVGYGHYAKDLIIPAYLRHGGVEICGVVGRQLPERVNPDYVYDLCIPTDEICVTLNRYAARGARKFILPKPIANTAKQLGEIIHIWNGLNLSICIASQWVYDSELMANIAAAKEVAFVFEQNIYGKPYTMQAAFLPHVIHAAECNMDDIKIEYVYRGDDLKRRVMFFDGKEMDLLDRPDMFNPMISDFIRYFDWRKFVPTCMGDYIAVAKKYLSEVNK